MRPQVNTLTTLVNDANGIFEDQTTAGSGALSLDGALVDTAIAYCYGRVDNLTIRQAQRIAIEGTGNNSGVIATIIGTDAGGAPYTEALTLANAGTATTTGYFKTVSSITVDGAVTGNIEGGWLSSGTDPAVMHASAMDRIVGGNIGINVQIPSGTLTVTAQYTFSMPQDDYGTSSWNNAAVWEDVDGLTAVTATDSSNAIVNVMGIRLEINSYTSGNPKFTVTQPTIV